VAEVVLSTGTTALAVGGVSLPGIIIAIVVAVVALLMVAVVAVLITAVSALAAAADSLATAILLGLVASGVTPLAGFSFGAFALLPLAFAFGPISLRRHRFVDPNTHAAECSHGTDDVLDLSEYAAHVANGVSDALGWGIGTYSRSSFSSSLFSV
jgi:hypothetical protein